MARPRPVLWIRSHPIAADWMLASLVMAMSLLSHLTVRGEGIGTPKWFSVVLTVAATLPIAARRRAPIATLVAVLIAQMLLEVGNFEGAGWSGVIVATYTLGAYVSGRRRTVTASLCLAAALILIVVGLFMDINAALLILAPVLGPLTLSIGVDPVHAGIMIILALNISLMTPPVGACLFVLSSVTGERMEAIARDLLPFIVAELLVLLLIAFWPKLTLFVPHLLGF